MKKMLSLLLATAMLMAVTAMPAWGAEQTVKIVLEDVTEQDTGTLAGESKIKVSAEGITDSVSIAQLYMNFSGDLKYKSITYLTGKSDPENGSMIVSPNAAAANSEGCIKTGMISVKDPIEFSEMTELFILTFSGEPGQEVKLSVTDTENSYFQLANGNTFYAESVELGGVKAIDSDNKGKEATVILTLDRVSDFAAANGNGYLSSGLELKITNEGNNGNVIYTVLNNITTTGGGHRDGTKTIPTFIVKNTVLDGNTYTVELSGIGYVTYRKEGVNFDEAVEITNAEFIPGDVNADGVVDITDKELCEAAVNDPSLADASMDFNRDGVTDKYDLAVFGEFKPTPKAPEKVTDITLDAASNQITARWKAPNDGGSEITKYIVKYGTNEDNLSTSVETKTTEAEIKPLMSNKKYYLTVTAVNAVGESIVSEVVSATTAIATSDNSGAGGGGTGGGNGGGGNRGGANTGGAATVPINPTDKNVTENNQKIFKDMGNYSWAEEAVYSLRDKGIINGVSDTEFAPNNSINRCDFILILTRMLNINDEFTENFSDVTPDKYYYNAVGSAKAAGIANGDGEGFKPERTIMRQDLITLAYRAFLAKGYIEQTEDTSILDEFSDKDEIASYAVGPMAAMVKAGIIKGSDGKVNPKGNATRAEAAVMCNRLYDLMK